jgi:hypothetical protein
MQDYFQKSERRLWHSVHATPNISIPGCKKKFEKKHAKNSFLMPGTDIYYKEIKINTMMIPQEDLVKTNGQICSITNFPQYPDAYQNFVTDTLATAKSNGITIRCDSNLYIGDDDQFKCTGYFYSGKRELALSDNHAGGIHNWMRIFIHESARMDLWLQDKKFWKDNIKGAGIYFDFLEKKINLPPEEMEDCIQNVMTLELECQNRGIEKIRKYNLPLNINEYKKKVNDYLCMITYCAEKRRLYNRLCSDELGVSPIGFLSSFTALPEKVYNSFENYATSETFFRLKFLRGLLAKAG